MRAVPLSLLLLTLALKCWAATDVSKWFPWEHGLVQRWVFSHRTHSPMPALPRRLGHGLHASGSGSSRKPATPCGHFTEERGLRQGTSFCPGCCRVLRHWIDSQLCSAGYFHPALMRDKKISRYFRCASLTCMLFGFFVRIEHVSDVCPFPQQKYRPRACIRLRADSPGHFLPTQKMYPRISPTFIARGC